MAYRMVSTRMWSDLRVVGAAREVVVYLMTGPSRSVLPGLVPLGPAGLAEAMRLPPATVRRALGELQSGGLVELDAALPLIRLAPAPGWDSPPTAKVLGAWARVLRDLPTSPLVARHLITLAAEARKRCKAEDVDAFETEAASLGYGAEAASDSEGLGGVSDTLSIASPIAPRARARTSDLRSPSPSPSPSPAEATRGEEHAVFDHWLAVLGNPILRPKRKLQATKSRLAPIRARLRDGYTVAELCTAIDAVARSGFHRGDNEDGAPYIEPKTIFRNEEKVDGWLAAKPPQKTIDKANGTATRAVDFVEALIAEGQA